MGFIETPYRKVEQGKVDLDNADIRYYSAEEGGGTGRRAVQRAYRRRRTLHASRAYQGASGCRLPRRPRRRGVVDGRGSEPDRLDRREPYPLLGARRCQPCAYGFEHDASGRASGKMRGADRRHRHREGHDYRQPHTDRRRGRRRGRLCRCHRDPRALRALAGRGHQLVPARGNHLHAAALPSYKPEYDRHAAPRRTYGRPCGQGADPYRGLFDRKRASWLWDAT